VSEDRELGVRLYNHTWSLFDERDSDDELIHTAHASAYHWLQAPEATPANHARSEWLCSRTYSVLGRAEPAVHHAQRCLQLVEQNPDAMEEWDLAAAYEAVARAQLVAGNAEAAARAADAGRAALEHISDPDDRSPLAADLDSLEL
jgi:hypothetical protein